MNLKTFTSIAGVIFLAVSLCTSAGAQEREHGTARLREVKVQRGGSQSAPAQCIDSLRAFFNYLRREEPDISKDKEAQFRWLTEGLQKAMADKVAFEDGKAKQSPSDKREYPENASFVGAWDFPSTYSIVGSRCYDKISIIDVEYRWAKGTQYEGNKSLRSFIFVKEANSWRVDEIYTFSGKFESSESLKNYFIQTY